MSLSKFPYSEPQFPHLYNDPVGQMPFSPPTVQNCYAHTVATSHMWLFKFILVTLATFQALNNQGWAVVPLVDGTDTKHSEVLLDSTNLDVCENLANNVPASLQPPALPWPNGREPGGATGFHTLDPHTVHAPDLLNHRWHTCKWSVSPHRKSNFFSQSFSFVPKLGT